MEIEDEEAPPAGRDRAAAAKKFTALTIDFRQEGNAAAFLGEGWSIQEPDGIWSVGECSELTLPPHPGNCAFVLEMVAWPMVCPPALMQQKLEIYLNEHVVFSAMLSEPEPRVVTFRIPPGMLYADRRTVLMLRHPDAAAPADFIVSHGDYRRLGIHVVRLSIEAALNEAPSSDPAPQAATGHAVDDRSVILFYWGETPWEISCILEGFPPFDDAFRFHFVNDSIPWNSAFAELSERDRRRVIALWAEVVPPAEDEGASQLDARDTGPWHWRDGLRHVKIPRPIANCLWPLRGHDPRLVLEPPLYPRGRYPYTDRAAFDLVAERELPDDRLYAQYLAHSQQIMPDLAAAFSHDVRSWTALDKRCDIKIRDFIVANFRSSRLFHAPESPAAPLLAYIVEHLLATLLPTLPLLPSALLHEFVYYVHGYQGPFLNQAPVHPLVAERLGLSFLAPDELYRRGHTMRTFRQHILDYIRWEPWFS
jgi:hypothetical protein